MRITQRAVALSSLQGLNRNLDAVGRLQQQLTSGRMISTPSDSPTGTNWAMQTRADQASVAQQARNISDGKAWVGAADSALMTMLETTRRVRDLAVQGLNTGSMSPAGAEAIALEVTNLRDSLLGLANQTLGGRPLFGGVTAGRSAYDAAGGWVGTDGAPVQRRISDTEVVRIDITGPEAFGPPGDDLFAVVGRIADDVTTDPAALAADLEDLDVAIDRMLTALADVGARSARIEHAEQVNTDRSLTLATQLSEIEGVDLPRTIMELEMQKVGYEAALAATAKALQPTLLDFLR
ncbi:MAG TPA: flagellin [Geodermatophilus sp.]|nr:flagellin [Geodermatophilus sp.]